jgi:hypothetical protein
MHREGGTMKTTSFATAALIAGLLAFATLAGPAAAQPYRNYRNNVRVFTPQVNIYAGQLGGYTGYVPPTSYSSFASPYRGYSSYVSPYGTSYSAYSAQSFPRILTPYGPIPTTYNTYTASSFYNPGFGYPGYPGYVAPSAYSSIASPYNGSTVYSTPYGNVYSGYAAQDFPRVLTPYGSVPTNYNLYFGASSPYGSTLNSPYVNPYAIGP